MVESADKDAFLGFLKDNKIQEDPMIVNFGLAVWRACKEYYGVGHKLSI